MNAAAEGVARLGVGGHGAPGPVAGDVTLRNSALHAGELLTHLEAELGVQGQRAVVVSGLNKADSWGTALGGAPHHVLHEQSTYSTVLDGGVYRNRADAADGRAFVEKVTAHNPAIGFGYHRVETRMAEQHRHQPDCRLSQNVRGKVMFPGYRSECFVADPCARFGVFGFTRPQLAIHNAASQNRCFRYLVCSCPVFNPLTASSKELIVALLQGC